MICCMGRLLDFGSLSRTWLITSWNTSNSGLTMKLMKPTTWHVAWLLNHRAEDRKKNFYRSEIEELLLWSCHTKEKHPAPFPSPCPPGWRTPPCTWPSTPCAGPRPWWGGPRPHSGARDTAPWSYPPQRCVFCKGRVLQWGAHVWASSIASWLD